MIVYFDTSAFVPLLLKEPASGSFTRLWEQADKVVSTRLLFVEAASTLERARRAGRISSVASIGAFERLEQLWRKVLVSELNETLMLESSILASRFGLRGFDSVHCAAAFRMNGEGVIAASSDKQLNEAWSDLGLATFAPGP